MILVKSNSIYKRTTGYWLSLMVFKTYTGYWLSLMAFTNVPQDTG